MAGAIALTPHQINKVLDKCLLMQDKETKRAAIAISHAGLRVSELARLEIKDVMYSSGRLRTEVFLPAKICKGTKPRTVWFSNLKTLKIIQDLVDYRLKKRWGTGLKKDQHQYQGLNPETRLLFNNRGRPFAMATKKRVLVDGTIEEYKACDTLQIMMQGVYNRCGFKNASSHTGRKSLATNAALRGVPLETIAYLLGHEDPEMTMVYVEINQKQIERAYGVAI
jgi:integrase